jgi:steroid delta-isomerase
MRTRFLFLFPVALTLVLLLAGAQASPAQEPSFDIEQAVHAYFEKVEQNDIDGFVQLFTPDGVLEDPVGTPQHRGERAIREFVEEIVAPFSEIHVTLHRIFVVSPTEAAVSWTIHSVTKAGKPAELSGIGIFKFNDDGKLRSVREYWELADYLAQF